MTDIHLLSNSWWNLDLFLKNFLQRVCLLPKSDSAGSYTPRQFIYYIPRKAFCVYNDTCCPKSCRASLVIIGFWVGKIWCCAVILTTSWALLWPISIFKIQLCCTLMRLLVCYWLAGAGTGETIPMVLCRVAVRKIFQGEVCVCYFSWHWRIFSPIFLIETLSMMEDILEQSIHFKKRKLGFKVLEAIIIINIIYFVYCWLTKSLKTIN